MKTGGDFRDNLVDLTDGSARPGDNTEKQSQRKVSIFNFDFVLYLEAGKGCVQCTDSLVPLKHIVRRTNSLHLNFELHSLHYLPQVNPHGDKATVPTIRMSFTLIVIKSEYCTFYYTTNIACLIF